MASPAATVLILGHSFVKRLQSDIETGFDSRVDGNFNLHGSAFVHMFGVGGRTVSKLQAHDLNVIPRLAPDVVILEIGTNDLSQSGPEVLASEIEVLVSLLREKIFCSRHRHLPSHSSWSVVRGLSVLQYKSASSTSVS